MNFNLLIPLVLMLSGILRASATARECNPVTATERYVILGDSHFTNATGDAFEEGLSGLPGRIDRYAVFGATACDWLKESHSVMREKDAVTKREQFYCPGNGVGKTEVPSSFPMTSQLLGAARPPKGVIVQSGTNDIARLCAKLKPDTNFACVKQLIEKIVAKTPNCVWVGPPAYLGWEACKISTGEFGKWSRALATAVTETKKCIYISPTQCESYKLPKSGGHYSSLRPDRNKPSEAELAGHCFAKLVKSALTRKAEGKPDERQTISQQDRQQN